MSKTSPLPKISSSPEGKIAITVSKVATVIFIKWPIFIPERGWISIVGQKLSFSREWGRPNHVVWLIWGVCVSKGHRLEAIINYIAHNTFNDMTTPDTKFVIALHL